MARTAIPVIVLDDVTGAFVQNAQVSITYRDTSAAIVYQAETGGSTRTQPLLTDAQGRVDGWLDRGSYTITIVVPSRPTRTEYFDSSPGGDGSIDGVWISAGAVTGPKLAADAVDNTKILDGTVGPSELASSAVTTTKIAANAVDSTKLASDASVDANRAVGTNHLKDGSVTPAKLSAPMVLSDRTLAVKTANSFQVGGGNGPLSSYIFPYNYPSANQTYYRDFYYFWGGTTQTDESLDNVSDRVTVSVVTGGMAPLFFGHVGLDLVLDGTPQSLLTTTVTNSIYTWNVWSYTAGSFDSLNVTKTFTVPPGTHTWNVRVSFSNYFSIFGYWLSAGTSTVTIKETPAL